MNITPISFRLFQNNRQVQNNNYADNRLIKPKYRNQLTQDTVSFQAATYHKAVSDCIEKKYIKEAPRLKRIATTFLDTVESVAYKYKEYGVSFVREMFEGTAVKEVDSKLSKIVRAKTFDDRDAIRTTLFIKNPYDLSILFDKIIPDFGPDADRIYQIARIHVPVADLVKRGYMPLDEIDLIKKFFEIPHTKESHNKYFRELKKLNYDYDDTKKVLSEFLKSDKTPTRDDIVEIASTLKKDMPDVDIRLDHKLLDMNSILEEYKYCIGEPHGPYEDIQIRFVRTTERDIDRPVYHELLIHFGPKYNRNAFKEHNWVYEPLRLFKELNIPITENIGKNVDFAEYPEQGVAKLIKEVKEFFRTKISHKLIDNGKNIDYYGENKEEPIFIAYDEAEKFEKKMKSLKYYLKQYYEKVKANTQVSTIASEQVEKEAKADIKLINKIWRKLDETIYNINHEFGLKEV